MQTEAKRAAIDARGMAGEMLAMAVRALVAGLAVSIGAALLIVAAVIVGS